MFDHAGIAQRASDRKEAAVGGDGMVSKVGGVTRRGDGGWGRAPYRTGFLGYWMKSSNNR
jgi:hypothetical protein